jgi:transposase-like protein
LESLVIAGFVRGLSVRDVEATLAEALGAEAALSKSSVSRICQAIAEQFTAWRGRRLDLLSLDYLFLDGSHFKMHPGSPAEPILAAWGISTDGKPVLVGLDVAAGESADAWDAFLDGLADRGLRAPLLVISDGAAGLIGAIERNLPHALRQRCLVHRARNLLAKTPKKDQDEVKAAYWKLFDVPDDIDPGQAAVDHGQKQIDAFAARYGKRLPAAVRCLLDDRAALTAYLRFPREHWHRIRHSNVIWVNRPTETRLADTVRASRCRERSGFILNLDAARGGDHDGRGGARGRLVPVGWLVAWCRGGQRVSGTSADPPVLGGDGARVRVRRRMSGPVFGGAGARARRRGAHRCL